MSSSISSAHVRGAPAPRQTSPWVPDRSRRPGPAEGPFLERPRPPTGARGQDVHEREETELSEKRKGSRRGGRGAGAADCSVQTVDPGVSVRRGLLSKIQDRAESAGQASSRSGAAAGAKAPGPVWRGQRGRGKDRRQGRGQSRCRDSGRCDLVGHREAAGVCPEWRAAAVGASAERGDLIGAGGSPGGRADLARGVEPAPGT